MFQVYFICQIGLLSSEKNCENIALLILMPTQTIILKLISGTNDPEFKQTPQVKGYYGPHKIAFTSDPLATNPGAAQKPPQVL